MSFFWLTLEVALDLERVVSFVPSLGMPLASLVLSNTAWNIYCLFQLKFDKIFKMIVF